LQAAVRAQFLMAAAAALVVIAIAQAEKLQVVVVLQKHHCRFLKIQIILFLLALVAYLMVVQVVAEPIVFFLQ
jgi:hypothetical protein